MLLIDDLNIALDKLDSAPSTQTHGAITGRSSIPTLSKQALILLICIAMILIILGLGNFGFHWGVAPSTTATITTAGGSTPSGEPTPVATERVSPAEEPTATHQTDPTHTPTIQATDAVITPNPLLSEPTPTPSPSEQPTASPSSTPLGAQEAASIRATHDEVVDRDYRLILRETFDRGNTTLKDWPEGVKVKRLRHNRYEITLDQPHQIISEIWKKGANSKLSDNYMLELEVRFPSLNPTAEVGLVFDAQDEDGKTLFYTMRSDGKWRVYQDNNLIIEGDRPTNFAVNPDTKYTLWVWHQSDAMVFFFNGVAVAKTAASLYHGGRVGIVGIAGDDASALVVADTLWVRQRR